MKNHIADESLWEELLQLKMMKLNLKRVRDLNRLLSKDTQIAISTKKGCPTSLQPLGNQSYKNKPLHTSEAEGRGGEVAEWGCKMTWPVTSYKRYPLGNIGPSNSSPTRWSEIKTHKLEHECA